MAIEYEKFESVFQSIDNHLSRQVDIMEQMLFIQIEDKETSKRKERFESLKEDQDAFSPMPYSAAPSFFPDQVQAPSKPYEPTQDQQEQLVDNIIPGIGLGLGSGIPSLLKNAVGKLPVLALGGLAIALQEPIKDFLSSFIIEGLNQVDPSDTTLSPEMKGALTEGFTSTIFWGGLGRIIGGYPGLGIALGGIIYDSMYNYIEDNDSDIANFIRDNINIEAVAVGAGAIGPLLGLAVGKGLKAGITKAGGIKAVITSSVARKFVFGLGIAGLLYTFSDEIGDVLEEQFDSELARDYGNIVMSSTALGSLFGVKGAIAGAIVGIALSGGMWLLDYLQGQDEKIVEALKKRTDKRMAEAERLREEGDLEGAAREMEKAAQEVFQETERRSQLAVDESKEEIQSLRDEVSSQLDNMKGLSPGRKMNLIEQRFETSDQTEEDLRRYILDSAAVIKEALDTRGQDITFGDSLLDVERPSDIPKVRYDETVNELLMGPQSYDIQGKSSTSKTDKVSESAREEKANASVSVRGGDSYSRGGDVHNNYNAINTVTPDSNLNTPF